VLERKLAVQQEELALASRELDEMVAELRKTQPSGGGSASHASASAEAAWRDIQAAGGARPDTDLEGELLKAQAERKLHEAAVDAQLAHLKKKLGRE
jgi:hypothetical protein